MLTMYNNKNDFQTSGCQIAVLPVGALEQHGSHLPVGTDALIAGEFAKRIAEKLGAYLLPAVSISCSIEHRMSKGTVYLKASTLAAIIRDIAESLQFSGFKKLYIVNGHGGNWIIKPTVRELNRSLEQMDVVLLTSQVARARIREVMEHGVPPDIHAGETETSVMLHLYPEHVGPVHVPASSREFYPQDYMDYFDAGELSGDGCWGHPECATAEKGERWLDILVESAIDMIRHIEVTRQRLESRRAGSNNPLAAQPADPAQISDKE